jgi:hypothetical protein
VTIFLSSVSNLVVLYHQCKPRICQPLVGDNRKLLVRLSGVVPDYAINEVVLGPIILLARFSGRRCLNTWGVRSSIRAFNFSAAIEDKF